MTPAEARAMTVLAIQFQVLLFMLVFLLISHPVASGFEVTTQKR